jgi:hypothetical protein
MSYFCSCDGSACTVSHINSNEGIEMDTSWSVFMKHHATQSGCCKSLTSTYKPPLPGAQNRATLFIGLRYLLEILFSSVFRKCGEDSILARAKYFLLARNPFLQERYDVCHHLFRECQQCCTRPLRGGPPPPPPPQAKFFYIKKEKKTAQV